MLSDLRFNLERILCFPVTYMCVIVVVLDVFVGGDWSCGTNLYWGPTCLVKYHDSDANSSKSTVNRSVACEREVVVSIPDCATPKTL